VVAGHDLGQGVGALPRFDFLLADLAVVIAVHFREIGIHVLEEDGARDRLGSGRARRGLRDERHSTEQGRDGQR
jgi:hypothetical protein